LEIKQTKEDIQKYKIIERLKGRSRKWCHVHSVIVAILLVRGTREVYLCCYLLSAGNILSFGYSDGDYFFLQKVQVPVGFINS